MLIQKPKYLRLYDFSFLKLKKILTEYNPFIGFVTTTKAKTKHSNIGESNSISLIPAMFLYNLQAQNLSVQTQSKCGAKEIPSTAAHQTQHVCSPQCTLYRF